MIKIQQNSFLLSGILFCLGTTLGGCSQNRAFEKIKIEFYSHLDSLQREDAPTGLPLHQMSEPGSKIVAYKKWLKELSLLKADHLHAEKRPELSMLMVSIRNKLDSLYLLHQDPDQYNIVPFVEKAIRSGKAENCKKIIALMPQYYAIAMTNLNLAADSAFHYSWAPEKREEILVQLHKACSLLVPADRTGCEAARIAMKQFIGFCNAKRLDALDKKMSAE